VAGKAIKGPAAKMMDELGLGSSAAAVALHYAELVDVFVLDQQDEALAQEIERRGIKVVVTNTIMNSLESKISLAKTVLDAIRTPRD
jgi:LPPG:FO 2-phospho-L-lactate transferase